MAAPAPVKLTGKPAEINAFLDRFDVFLFDCDGVLWQGNQLLPRTAETLSMLRARGKQLVFVTNNSTKSRAAYVAKFAQMGLPGVRASEIFGSAYSSAVYISKVLRYPAHKKVYVIGERGVCEELAAAGIQYVGGDDDAGENAPMAEADYDAFAPADDVEIVLVGLDHAVNYRKLARAFQFLRNPNCVFLATNTDSTFPTHGKLFPGAGAISAPLAFMTGRAPLSLGKPSAAMMDAIEAGFSFDRKRTCMVGDRLNTDIAFGRDSGLGGTLAVLTGVATEASLLDEKEVARPDAYVDSLCDLLG